MDVSRHGLVSRPVLRLAFAGLGLVSDFEAEIPSLSCTSFCYFFTFLPCNSLSIKQMCVHPTHANLVVPVTFWLMGMATAAPVGVECLVPTVNSVVYHLFHLFLQYMFSCLSEHIILISCCYSCIVSHSQFY